MSQSRTGFQCTAGKFLHYPAGFARSRVTSRHVLSGFIISVLGWMSLSCGSGHAVFQITAPARVVAGVPFSVTVTAMYQGKVDAVINGPVHFTTTDSAAHLPTLYVFTAADAGSHTFTDLTLVTPGDQSITVSDYDATPITGTANMEVAAGPADVLK